MKKTFLLLWCYIPALLVNAQSYGFEWVKQMGGIYPDYGYSNKIDNHGNVYAMGMFQLKADFDPGIGSYNLTSSGFTDVFISKLDPSGNFLWAKKIGGDDKDVGNSMAIDEKGNVCITGYFNGTVDFDPGKDTFNLTSESVWDVYILKLNSSGEFLWAKKIGGEMGDEGMSISIDKLGNIYTTGIFVGKVDFDPGLDSFYLNTGKVNYDIFISKLDPNGNFVWAKNIGGSNGVFSTCIILDSVGNIYATGFFQQTVDFNPNPSIKFNLTATGTDDIFILKLNNQGNFAWAKRIGHGASYFEKPEIDIDSKGNLYIIGTFKGTTDFNTGIEVYSLRSAGEEDVFISKIDSLGNFVWAKQIGGLNNDEGHSIIIDNYDNIYFTGIFQKSIEFPETKQFAWSDNFYLTSNGEEDIFIAKYNSSGKYIWATSIGGKFNDNVFSISIDSSLNIYTIGYFNDTVDFYPGPNKFHLTAFDFEDIFIYKMKLCPKIDITTTRQGVAIKANQDNATYQWIDGNNGESPISGETNQTFQPKVNSVYAVIVSIGSCSAVSKWIEVTNVKIKENSWSRVILIHPNPTSGTLNIESQNLNTSELKIQILNPIGQIVLEETDIQHLPAGRQGSQFNIQNLPQGLYLVRVISDNQIIATQKIIKQ